jgi:hypothetical protein
LNIDILIMKKLTGLFVIFLLAAGVTSSAKASTMLVEHETNPVNDTAVEVKSNVVIFKLISTPIASTTSNNSGSLKKAGKVARTSYSHCTSIENIIYKKKGI